MDKKNPALCIFFIFHDFLWYGRLIRILKKTVLMEIRTIETNKDLLYLVIEHLIYKSCVQVSAGPFLDGWKVSSILIHCGLGLSYSNLLLAFAGVKNQLDLRDECVAVIFLYFLIVFYSPQNGKGVYFFLSYGLISSHQCK